MHKIINNSIKDRGSSTILVGVNLRNIHTKFEANPCSSLREDVKKGKTVHNDNDDDGHRVIARVTLTHFQLTFPDFQMIFPLFLSE